MEVQYPFINGVLYEKSSIEIKIDGLKYTGAKAIDYDEAVEPEAEYGTSPDVIGATRGKRVATGSVELYLPEFQRLLNKLGAGFYEKIFQITVSYEEPALGTIVDQLVNCRIKKPAASMPDTGALTRKVDLFIFKILWNGVDGVTNPLTGATAGAGT